VDNPIWAYIFGAPKEKRAMVELMKLLPAFEGLSVNELLTVERTIHQRRYGAGEVIFNEDMPGAGMYIIQEGEVSIIKKIDERNDVELAVVKERSFFGELALIDEMPRSATAKALKDTALFAFCKPDLEKIMDRNPRLASKIIMNVARLICKRLVQANENLEVIKKKLLQHGDIIEK
jgi:CRP-like cAMP-binding protein